MTPPKNIFLVVANLRKISLKSWQFSKKSYWDFLSIFSDDFFIYDSDATIEQFSLFLALLRLRGDLVNNCQK